VGAWLQDSGTGFMFGLQCSLPFRGEAWDKVRALDLKGRVAAVNGIFIGASNQLGEFESGATAAWMGPVGSVVFGGVGTVVVAVLWLRLFPQLAQRDRMT
jgi:hypothetical protein